MLKRLSYVLRAFPGRGWGSIPRVAPKARGPSGTGRLSHIARDVLPVRGKAAESGDARHGRRAVTLLTALLLLPTLSPAQTASDVFACAQPGVHFGELKGRFASLSWDATPPDRSDILRQLIFLGNAEALAPEGWAGVSDWARDLADHPSDKPYAIYALDDSAVLLEGLKNGDIACFFVSDKEINNEFLNRFPQLEIRYVQERGFGWLDREHLRVTAAFVSDPSSRLILFSEGRRTTATIINKSKSASAKED